MPGVPRKLAEHSLNVNKGAKPVKQGTRRYGEAKRKAIGKEIIKLQEAKFIREVVHTNWLANPVMVPKPNKEMRMCIDYTVEELFPRTRDISLSQESIRG